MNLGKKTVSEIEQYLEANFDYYIMSVEKDGSERHIQGGVFSKTQKRQDHIRAKFKQFALSIYHENEEGNDDIISTKKLENISKHAVMVKEHDSFRELVRYCSKEGFFAVHRYKLNEPHEMYLKSLIYCRDHGNPLSIFHESSATDERPFHSCPKCPKLPDYFMNFNNLQPDNPAFYEFLKEYKCPPSYIWDPEKGWIQKM